MSESFTNVWVIFVGASVLVVSFWLLLPDRARAAAQAGEVVFAVGAGAGWRVLALAGSVMISSLEVALGHLVSWILLVIVRHRLSWAAVGFGTLLVVCGSLPMQGLIRLLVLAALGHILFRLVRDYLVKRKPPGGKGSAGGAAAGAIP